VGTLSTLKELSNVSAHAEQSERHRYLIFHVEVGRVRRGHMTKPSTARWSDHEYSKVLERRMLPSLPRHRLYLSHTPPNNPVIPSQVYYKP